MRQLIKFCLTIGMLISVCGAAFAQDAGDDVSSDVIVVKKRKAAAESEQRMLLTVGGGLGLNLPAISIVHDGYNNANNGTSKTNTFVAFGVDIFANATFTYRLDARWELGAAVNLGYNVMGGPHALYEVRYENKKYTNTYKGLGAAYHSFVADINFAVRTPPKKNGDLLLEIGARLMPTWTSLVYRQDGQTKTGEDAYSNESYQNPETRVDEYFYYPGTESTMMAGPDLFVGIDFFALKNLDVIAGLRVAAVFGCANTWYTDNGIHDRSYLNSIITVAFEARVNWFRHF